MFGLLNGKKAMVTGGAQGIGKAIAQIYAENGADVAVCDMNEAQAAQTAAEIGAATGRTCFAVHMDVSSKESVESGVGTVTERMGRIDVLCHSAGILIEELLLEMSEQAWDKIFAVNVKGTFLVNQAVGRVMKAQGGGKIVNISSCSAKKPTWKETAYCATKGAVGAIVRNAALELGQYGINVNAVLPGATDTDMTRKNFLTSPEIEREWIEKTALKRLGQPVDQARVALFLSSELADHVTGESIVVSAGEMMTQ